MPRLLPLLLLVGLCFPVMVSAQIFAFDRGDSLYVRENNDTLLYAFGGGMNYCQFSNIDLDYDGDQDLFVFDRTGNRIMTFTWDNGWHMDYSYVAAFPRITDWALLRDYDGDGKADLFTYYSGGVSVYRNTGDAQNGLEFTLVKQHIRSFYGVPNLVLYISLADIAAFDDIDGDGDLDIITFENTGGCVEFHKNLSIETYGHADSLQFRRVSDNWGNFTESGTSGSITLNDSCDRLGGMVRHVGSSLLTLDMDADGDKDLVLGDVEGANLSLLINGGTPSQAHMVSVDMNFPQHHQSTFPVNLQLFPAAYYVDINGDAVRDLVVSPNSITGSESAKGMVRYLNMGADNMPDFELVDSRFLQGEMIELGEGAFPRWVDYNRDGIIDLAIGNNTYFNGKGQLAVYAGSMNSGSLSFQLVGRNIASLTNQNYTSVIPAFGDLDGDGDEDMIIGETTGFIHYFENVAPVASNTNAQYILASSQYFNIKELSHSAPFLIDLDNDGKLDIVNGSRNGRLNFYRNTGTVQSPSFSSTPTIADLGGVNVTDINVGSNGYSVPYFFTWNGKTELFVGSYRGTIFHYSDLHDGQGAISSSFSSQTDQVWYIRSGERVAPAVYDLDGDAYPDMVIGNNSGGVEYFRGVQAHVGVPGITANAAVRIYPNPVTDWFFIETSVSSYEVRIFDLAGKCVWQKELSASGSVNVSGLQPGIYFCSIEIPGRQPEVIKIIRL